MSNHGQPWLTMVTHGYPRLERSDFKAGSAGCEWEGWTAAAPTRSAKALGFTHETSSQAFALLALLAILALTRKLSDGCPSYQY